MKDTSKLVHKGRNSTAHFGTVNTPIIQSSTIIFPDLQSYDRAEDGEIHYKPIFDSITTDPAYGIAGNQTHYALQEILNSLENATSCFLTSSGLSAITTALIANLTSGDHLLMVDAVYGPTRRFCNKTLKNFGIETTYYDPEIAGGIEALIKPNTKVIFLESPGSLTFEVQDIPAIVKVAKQRNITTIIDNSWATPLFFKPLDYGVDISIQALTKYVSGSADLLLGAILTKSSEYSNKLANTYKNLGLTVSAFNCYLALRGIRTMKARLDFQKNSLQKILQYLATIPQVSEILCPCYEKFKGYDIWKRDFTGSTALFSVVLDKKYPQAQLAKMIDGYKYFAIGASWGGFESLVRVVKLEGVRTINQNKYNGSIIRYYLGLEDVDDLINDLKSGFDRLL